MIKKLDDHKLNHCPINEHDCLTLNLGFNFGDKYDNRAISVGAIKVLIQHLKNGDFRYD